MRTPLALAALTTILLSTTAAFAEVNADCKSNNPTVSIPACTAIVSASGTSKDDMVEALFRRADHLIATNALDKAAADLQRAIELAPRNAGVLSVRGRLLKVRADFANALKDLNAALQIKSNSVYALNQRAEVFLALGRTAEARADADRALALAPTSANALTNRGRTLRATGQIDEAIADFDRALVISPKFVYALLHRADAWQAKGDLTRAIADYDRILTISPNYTVRHQQAPSGGNVSRRRRWPKRPEREPDADGASAATSRDLADPVRRD